jgi:nickel/cobalt exporter
MRRLLLLAALALLALPAAASAHPLGNFTVNRLDRVRISSDQVRVHYVLDQAEVPTFQERGSSDAEVLARKRAEVERGVRLTVGGVAVPLRLAPGGRITHPRGQGGLPLTRVELDLTAAVHDPRDVRLADTSFADRVGWRAIVVEPGSGTAVRSSVPSGDPTQGLRRYPANLLQSPPDLRAASFGVKPGDGTVTAPRAAGGRYETTRNQAGDGFAGLFADAAAGKGVLLLLLLASFGWGALHAVSPGHGKAMVAAYLIGTRGTAKHAIALGGIVTVTHTIGVFAIGLATLALSQYFLPEDLYPWLTLVSGLLVVAVGAGVLRSRIRSARGARAHAHDHHQEHAHGHSHSHGHGPGRHSHLPPDGLSRRGLVGMGASAGLIPCPSALVVLLAAIAQHQVGLGILLITVFSVGLAMTLTAIGIAVVYAQRLTTRARVPAQVATVLPALSAVVIVGVGCVLTARAIPTVL